MADPLGIPLGAVEAELARLWRPEGGAAPPVRACMANLIVFCPNADELERARRQLVEVTRQHPSRVVAVVMDGEADRIGAEVSAYCYAGGRGEKICAEEVVLRAGEAAAEGLPAAVRKLLIGDLPTALWWTPSDRAPARYGRRFDRLLELADHVLYDSRGWLDPVEEVIGHARWVAGVPERRALSDLAWRRLEPWRRLIARGLDPGVAPGALAGLFEVDIEHGPHALPKAWMLVGWLAERLGWSPVRGHVEPGVAVRWGLRSPAGVVEVRVRRRAEGEADLYGATFHWHLPGEAGRRGEERFERLGAGRLGVATTAAGSGADSPRAVAAPVASRAGLLALELRDRSGCRLFRAALESSRTLAEVLKQR